MAKKNRTVETGEGPWESQEPALEAAEAAPLPEPPVGVLPVREAGLVSLAVFLRLAGPKPDQLVPFARWARRHSPLAKSPADWRQIYNGFMNRPVTG
jgi:hypothetical protein